jgi:hypothetical protein
MDIPTDQIAASADASLADSPAPPLGLRQGMRIVASHFAEDL